jgi:hypothetical protein
MAEDDLLRQKRRDIQFSCENFHLPVPTSINPVARRDLIANTLHVFAQDSQKSGPLIEHFRGDSTSLEMLPAH